MVIVQGVQGGTGVIAESDTSLSGISLIWYIVNGFGHETRWGGLRRVSCTWGSKLTNSLRRIGMHRGALGSG